MKIGDSIKALRKQKGFGQRQLAEMCNITVTYLSLIETGKKEPTLALLRSIANALKTPLPILLFSTLSNDDIPESKRDFFDMVKPTIDSLLQQLISDNADSKD